MFYGPVSGVPHPNAAAIEIIYIRVDTVKAKRTITGKELSSSITGMVRIDQGRSVLRHLNQHFQFKTLLRAPTLFFLNLSHPEDLCIVRDNRHSSCSIPKTLRAQPPSRTVNQLRETHSR